MTYRTVSCSAVQYSSVLRKRTFYPYCTCIVQCRIVPYHLTGSLLIKQSYARKQYQSCRARNPAQLCKLSLLAHQPHEVGSITMLLPLPPPPPPPPPRGPGNLIRFDPMGGSMLDAVVDLTDNRTQRQMIEVTGWRLLLNLRSLRPRRRRCSSHSKPVNRSSFRAQCLAICRRLRRQQWRPLPRGTVAEAAARDYVSPPRLVKAQFSFLCSCAGWKREEGEDTLAVYTLPLPPSDRPTTLIAFAYSAALHSLLPYTPYCRRI